METSDQKFIEHIRAAEANRARRSTAFLTIGVILLVLAAIVTVRMFSFVITSDLLPVTAGCEDIILTVEKSSYWWGVTVGVAAGAAWLLAVHLLIAGISVRKGGRLERILLEKARITSPR